MATGYSREQLIELERELDENTPTIPTNSDKLKAPRVAALKAAGTDVGILFAFQLKGGTLLHVFLNCVVAKEFAAAVNLGDQAYQWRQRGLKPAPNGSVPNPLPDDLSTALNVLAFSTYSAPAGILANIYLPEGDTMLLFFPVGAALEIRACIATAGMSGKWWDSATFELIPRHVLN